MGIRGDERAVTVQIGAVILLAFVVIAITTYQTQVVPAQNEEVEFNHNQQVQQRMQDLRDVLVSVPATGSGGAVSVPLGTTYPARSIFVNPPPPGGTLSTVGTTNDSVAFAIGNATATDAEVGNYWNGSTHAFSTGALVFTPNYHAYENPPTTVYENSLLYNRFDSANLTLTGQTVVDGKRLTLVAVNGSLREGSGTASVTVRPVSASTAGIAVRNTSGERLTVTIPSTLSASEWQTLLSESGQYDGTGSSSNEAYVHAVRANGSTTVPGTSQRLHFVDIVMEADETYSLRLAKVGVGSGVTTREDGAYLAPVDSTSRQAPTGGSETLTVQVRDRFNNPQSGVTVNASVVSGGGSVASPTQVETGDDGRATFTYQAPASAGTAEVRMNISGGAKSWELVNFSVSVQATGGGGGGGNGAYQVQWQDPSGQSGVDCPSGPDATCTITGGTTTVDLVMNTNPTADGASVTYAVNNSMVSSLSRTSGTTNGTGENATTLSLAENGTVVVYTTSGAGGDNIRFEVSGLPGGGGGGGGSSADAVDQVGGSGAAFGGGSGARFTVENTGGSAVTITDIAVDVSGGGSISRVQEGNGGSLNSFQHEVYIDASTDGAYEPGGKPYHNDNGAPLQLGTTVTLTDSATINAGDSATIEFYQFQNNGGNSRSVSDKQLSVTVYYSDGTSETFTFTPP
ncbi:hypothetical protein [Haloarchaeobius sp. DFWS5]|uniref:hypothetical protein n=1 Tax=Haloarchaeobius sp. DFWS5 TaxID=3446114 RepID=UPI003EBEF220